MDGGRYHFNENFIDVINDTKKLLGDKDKFYTYLKKEGNTTLQSTKLKFIKEHAVLAVCNKIYNN